MKLDYAQLLETNNLLQKNGDETYWLCVTRTVQESKLFPVPSYMLLSYLMAFYRWPGLLKKIEKNMPAEQLGDRMRNMGVKCQGLSMWGLPCFYLLGREWLIAMGVVRPQDAAEDVAYILDFWKRFELSYRRNHGHMTASEAGHRSQIHAERQLQVFHADMYDCAAGDPLHEAAMTFIASASQYAFLISCESRISLHNHGPYNLGQKDNKNREMLVRDFMDLAEYDFPWLDGVGEDLPFNNLTVPMAVQGCHFNILDDWGSFEAEPEFKSAHVCAVGLYTSDPLSHGYEPYGMGSRDELTQTFTELNQKVKDATGKLWKRVAGWSRDQMLDAGAITYYSVIKNLAHVAGCYDPEDWIKVDQRAERFRGLLNDEYGRDCLGELCVGAAPHHQFNEYLMMRHCDLPQHIFTPIPYSILDDGDYAPSVGGVEPGITYLPEKKDVYQTTRGKLGIAEYNRQVQNTTPDIFRDEYRNLCETWVKYHYDSEQADAMYKAQQKNSRRLKDKGAGLRQNDIETLREK